MAMPTKSACALVRVAAVLASIHSGLPLPKACVMSPNGPVPVFSSSMLAVETPPKLQPARVYGTQGAGVFFCPSVTMFGNGSRVVAFGLESSTRSVQYLNELLNAGAFAGVLVGSK